MSQWHANNGAITRIEAIDMDPELPIPQENEPAAPLDEEAFNPVLLGLAWMVAAKAIRKAQASAAAA